ncbi:MAG: hypothetical protein ACXAEU_07425 [Candidatus Hodarchaeales archaeon]
MTAGSSRVIGWLLTHPWDGSRPPTTRIDDWGVPRWSSQHVRPVLERAHFHLSFPAPARVGLIAGS